MNTMPIKTTILGGFLGSGKTTVLNTLLQSLDSETRTVVIINDFGEVNIDSMMISKGVYSKKEITGGCICCSLKERLLDTLLKVVNEEQPDEIFIEATGLAVPWEMKQMIDKNFPSAKIIISQVLVCVDARQCDRYHDVLPAYSRQFEGEPLILMTKADMYDGGLLNKTREKLSLHYPGLTGSVLCRKGIWDEPLSTSLQKRENSSSPALSNFDRFNPGKDGIVSLSLKGRFTGTIAEMKTIINENRYKIIRLKSLIYQRGKVLNLQFDGEQTSLHSPPADTIPKGDSLLTFFCLKEETKFLKDRFSALFRVDNI
ncbi:hypothetical protein EXM22_00570 [Oceanispirochaeta crateris]|uniref:CobW/HypB/UreG nucleotide-binding domain-containing protein n=1 Tax=Oceanispirochaeta crateris TaxID=2518645 RepID=A0A5C1QER9_9SPIO|nr:GTP-binding protein [Oceanispirochaeta crateris]QEN06553.1 hypothetical protein EXM22_00570 [Oceanispirochaeta crateris]